MGTTESKSTLSSEKVNDDKAAKISEEEDVRSRILSASTTNTLSTSVQQPLKTLDSKLISNDEAQQLRNHLPGDLKLHNEWLLLYSSTKHGLSIRSFRDLVQYRGPSFLIIRDTFGAIFGGFASHEWAKSNAFYGDSSCFLFSLKPDGLNVYHATNSNNNFIFFNEGNDYNAYNGIGMGGRINFFSLSLDKTFERGTTRPGMLTFNSPCLCTDVYELEDLPDDIDQYHFKVDCIECWGFPLSESQTLELAFKMNQKSARVAAMKGDDADYFILEQAGIVGAGENFKEDRKRDDQNE